jgi:hypothetical protein
VCVLTAWRAGARAQGFFAALCHVAAARAAAGHAGVALTAPTPATAPKDAPLAGALEKLLVRHVCAQGATRVARAVQAATPDLHAAGAAEDVAAILKVRASDVAELLHALRRTRPACPHTGAALELSCLVTALRGFRLLGGDAPAAVPLLPLACAVLGLHHAGSNDVLKYKAVPLPLALTHKQLEGVLVAMAAMRAAKGKPSALPDALADTLVRWPCVAVRCFSCALSCRTLTQVPACCAG